MGDCKAPSREPGRGPFPFLARWKGFLWWISVIRWVVHRTGETNGKGTGASRKFGLSIARGETLIPLQKTGQAVGNLFPGTGLALHPQGRPCRTQHVPADECGESTGRGRCPHQGQYQGRTKSGQHECTQSASAELNFSGASMCRACPQPSKARIRALLICRAI